MLLYLGDDLELFGGPPIEQGIESHNCCIRGKLLTFLISQLIETEVV